MKLIYSLVLIPNKIKNFKYYFVEVAEKNVEFASRISIYNDSDDTLPIVRGVDPQEWM